ncbi:MAG: GAF domain-containing protein, partial [Burkholderiaceae bacterium]
MRPSTDLVRTVTDQIAAGQVAHAVATASAALADPALPDGERAALLEQRAECRLLTGEFAAAREDAQQVAQIGLRSADAAWSAVAQTLLSTAHQRLGDDQGAMAAAQAAAEAAEQSGDAVLVARALSARGLVRGRAGTDLEGALADANRAVALLEQAGDTWYLGRVALSARFIALHALGRTSGADATSRRQIELGRRIGDPFAVAQGLNQLTFHIGDHSEVLRIYRDAAAAFAQAGNVLGVTVVSGNVAGVYTELGLFHRGVRLGTEVCQRYRHMSAMDALLTSLTNLFEALVQLERIAEARAVLGEFTRVCVERRWPRLAGWSSFGEGRLASRAGQPVRAAAHFERAAREFGKVDFGFQMSALYEAAFAHLAQGDGRRALALTRRASQMHEAHGLGYLNGCDPMSVWWAHSRALQANGHTPEAQRALKRAYGMLLDSARSIRDEGLRRNLFNKRREVRDTLAAWLALARAQRWPKARREAHLRGQASLREPFERLVEVGLRLNELKTEAQWCEFLVDEVTELSGAERVLLLLADKDDALSLCGALVPAGEREEVLLEAIRPWLDDARRTRSARLRHGPDGAAPIDQRSCLVVPLMAQQELLGLLYVDIEGLYGRLHDGDMQLLSMLTTQAGLTLANLRAAADLERKVEERTAEARAAQASAEQRAAELAIINSIQQGIAGSLDFQGIVELVGDKLCEVMKSEDVGIVWIDHVTRTTTRLYDVEHGKRLFLPPSVISDDARWAAMVARREPFMLNTLAEGLAAGTLPGTDAALSTVMVPIVVGDRRIGGITLENHECEHAFSEAEVRLLQTVASSMGVALQSAKLFDETQRLLKETEQRNAELAVINSIQQGVAGSLDFQGIVDLVGDKLQEVLGVQDISITWFDHDARRIDYLYAREHGEAIGISSNAIKPGGPTERMIATRRPEVTNTSVEMDSVVAGTDVPKSVVRVPIVGSDRVLGAVQLENHVREHAYGESEVRLLQTVATSMGVALQSARLFDETQRLLKETDARAAELAIINGVQQGLAQKLDAASIYELVGDKLRELF